MHFRFLLLVSLVFSSIACAGTTSSPEPSSENIPQNETLSTSDLFELTRSGIARLEVSTCDGGGIGTGFMISEKQMVTVAHVVEGAEEILAIIDDEVAIASIIAIDLERDLALLETDIPFGDYYFTLGDFDYRTGDEVSVIGFPRGLDITLTKGTISNNNVKIPEFPLLTFVQIDAAANPGNSGGPVLNSKGEVIGILDMGLRESEGLNFAISVNTVDRIFNSWKNNTPITMASCGLSFEPEATNALPAPTEKEQSNPIALDPTPTPKIVLSLPVPQSSNDDNKPIKYTNDIVPSLKTGYPSRYEFTIVENDGIESIIPYIKTIGAPNSEINGCQLTWVSPPSESYKDTEARFKLRCIPLYEGFHSYHILISDKQGNIVELSNEQELRNSCPSRWDCDYIWTHSCTDSEGADGICDIDPSPLVSASELLKDLN